MQGSMKMNALATRLSNWLASVGLQGKPLSEPEPINAAERPMSGFFATLTEEQKRAAVDYRGPENVGGSLR
jgi:hypothetical protein